MAFVTAAPTHYRSGTSALATSTFAPAQKITITTAPQRRATLRMAADEKKKGFTLPAEQLNGRLAMLGFTLALATELITGKGIVGQLGSVTDTAKAILGL